MAISIEQVTTVEQCKSCHSLAARVWGNESACSIPQMMVHAKYGGVVLIAYDADMPIGFLFSFPAYYKGEFVLWSHETAVIPEYLHRGIGTKLKMEQRRLAKELGYKSIAWTFDPLISRNAHFNLNKLHAGISEYKVNTYGIMGDFINGAIETDRFIALWPVTDTDELKTAGDWNLQNGVLLDMDRELRPVEVTYEKNGKVVETRIPLTGEAILQSNQELAVAWRVAFRKVALELFQHGYSVIRFERHAEYGSYLWSL